MNELTISGEHSLSINLAEFQQNVREYTEASKSNNTRKAYSKDWKSFVSFCELASLSLMPASPDTVTAYIIYLDDVKGYKLSTIQRHL